MQNKEKTYMLSLNEVANSGGSHQLLAGTLYEGEKFCYGPLYSY